MRKSLALLLALGLTAGLMAAALTTSASAAPGPIATSIDSLKFTDGKFVGKLSADRRLCLNGRSVSILKVVAGEKKPVADAELNFNNWSDTHKASFSERHPAMDMTRKRGQTATQFRRARTRALEGHYIVRLDAAAVQEYSKAWTCTGAVGDLNIDL